MIKDFEIIKTEKMNGKKVEILEHVEYGEDIGFFIAKVDDEYYRFGIDGFYKNEFENGYYTKVEIKENE